MDDTADGPVTATPWGQLRRFTPARIALGRAGTSLPTQPHLAFQLAHARARDAVHRPLDVAALHAGLARRGLDPLVLHSAAADRHVYLQRPELGRRLDEASRAALAARAGGAWELALVIADGLSAFAVERNALPLLDVLLPRLVRAGWRLAPPAIVEQGRVAVGDEVAIALGARMVAILIGERPGLSSPDSMGIYFTFDPRPGITDAERNCISNVRREGLDAEHAAHTLLYLLGEARRSGRSGLALKDEAGAPAHRIAAHNVLLDE